MNLWLNQKKSQKMLRYAIYLYFCMERIETEKTRTWSVEMQNYDPKLFDP